MRCRRAKKATRLCCDCKKAPLVQYGRCTACFRLMVPALYARLKKLTRAERQIEFENTTGQPEPHRWEYENPQGEQELVERYGKNQDLRN